jgi:hypothetical protein
MPGVMRFARSQNELRVSVTPRENPHPIFLWKNGTKNG